MVLVVVVVEVEVEELLVEEVEEVDEADKVDEVDAMLPVVVDDTSFSTASPQPKIKRARMQGNTSNNIFLVIISFPIWPHSSAACRRLPW